MFLFHEVSYCLTLLTGKTVISVRLTTMDGCLMRRPNSFDAFVAYTGGSRSRMAFLPGIRAISGIFASPAHAAVHRIILLIGLSALLLVAAG
jgi:hypothetical protein